MYKKILLAIDLNDEWSWHKSLSAALQMCNTFDASLEIISVVPSFGNPWVGEFFPKGYELKILSKHESRLAEFVEKYCSDIGLVDYHVAIGKVYTEIIERAEKINADLIVMASHTPSSKDHILGPNSSQVVRHTKRSVFVVRG